MSRVSSSHAAQPHADWIALSTLTCPGARHRESTYHHDQIGPRECFVDEAIYRLLAPSIYGVTLRFGFREEPDVPAALENVATQGLQMETMLTTFFVTRGALIYTDEGGRQIGFEDVFTRLERFRRHVTENGLDPAVIERMIR